ncbi:MAG: NUDIX hydrolase [Ignavibacteriaceae bacterium]
MEIEFNFNQSGVVPYRKKDNGYEVLLITSIKKKRWIVPKGYVEFNLTPFESAKKEAFEEAGIIGSNETIELGSYSVNKSIGKQYIKMFSMEVIEVLDDYPEKNLRKRKWYSLKEAAKTVSLPEVSNMIISLENKIK